MNKTKQSHIIQKNSMNVIKTLKTVLVIALIGLFTLTSCKSKEDEEGVESHLPDGVALNQRFKDNRTNAIQNFTLDASAGGIVTGSQGTKVIIPANSIGLNGSPVTGDIEIELIEIYDKAAMVLQNKSTKGKRANNDEEALKSAGEFFVNAKQNGTQLEVLTLITVESRGVAPGEFEAMQVFRAGDDLQSEDLWEETDEDDDGENDNARGGEGQGPNGDFILFSALDMSSFGWTNLDIWYNFAGQLTDLFVDVPDGYTAENTSVYLSYDGENGLARMDVYDTSLELFTEHFGRIPVGQEVHFIMVVDIDGQLYYTIQAATIVEDHIEVMADPAPISQADLTTLINGLP